ncbi:MAG: biotin/lipoyl-containing protein [Bacillota bacterium]
MKTFKVTVDGQAYTVQVEELGHSTSQGSVKDVQKTVSKPSAAAPGPIKTEKTASTEAQPKETPKPAAAGGFEVKAPMPGSVLEVKVKVGDTISEGDVLLVLEAMKMENELTASQGGTVADVLVEKGDTVNSGDPLIVMS